MNTVTNQTVEDVLKEDSGLSEGDIANIAKFINDLNFALIEKYGVDFKPSRLGLLANTPLEAVSIPLNYQDGDTLSLAVAKAVIGASIGAGVGAAIAGGGFVATVGTAFAFGFFFGDVISDAVEAGYNYIVGPDFDFNTDTNKIDVDYTTYEALTATAGWVNDETLNQTIKNYNLSNWKLHSTHGNGGPDIEYVKSTNTYKIELSLQEAKNKNKDYIRALFQFSGDAEFNLEVNDGTHHIVDLQNKSQAEIKALMSSDSSVAYAVQYLQSYSIDSESFDISGYGESQKIDLASMLYYHLNREATGGENVTFKNLSTGKTVTHATSSSVREVVFGTSGGETISGTSRIQNKFYGNDGKNRLVNSIFYPYPALQKGNISSLTLVSSNNISFLSLDYEKNILFTNRFGDENKKEREVA
jgi:hypothetical protein